MLIFSLSTPCLPSRCPTHSRLRNGAAAGRRSLWLYMAYFRDGCMGVRVITLHPITSRGVYLQGWLCGGGDNHTHLMKSFLHPRGTTGADTSKVPVLVTLCQSVKLKLQHNHIPTALWSSEEQIQLLSWGPRSCLGANMNSFNFISLSQKPAEHDQSMSGQCRL